jgi:hypothetical protein
VKIINQEYSSFTKLDEGSCNNYYKNPEVRYYETEPYKGMPAVVPVNIQKGWYAATIQYFQ